MHPSASGANIYTLEEITKAFHYSMKQADNSYISVSVLLVEEINIYQHILTQSTVSKLE
jgi:hypothetical protein